jgi:hypothetical protein
VPSQGLLSFSHPRVKIHTGQMLFKLSVGEIVQSSSL